MSVGNIAKIKATFAVDVTGIQEAQTSVEKFENVSKKAFEQVAKSSKSGSERVKSSLNFLDAAFQASGVDIESYKKRMDFKAASKDISTHLQRIVIAAGLSSKEYLELTKSIIGTKGAMQSFANESAKVLGIKTQGQSLRELRDMRNAYFALRDSGVATTKDITNAQEALKKKTQELYGVTSKVKDKNLEITASNNTLASSFNSLRNMLFAYIGAYQIMSQVSAIKNTSIEFASYEKAFFAIKGSAAGAVQEMKWLSEQANMLGVDLRVVTESFKGFSVATEQAGFSTKETKEIFTNMMTATSVLGLSAEKTKLVFLAVEQMASKGCHAIGTLIKMFDNSLKTVEDVVVGDELLGRNGEKRTVLVKAAGSGRMFRIKPENSGDFEVNDMHILPLSNGQCVTVSDIETTVGLFLVQENGDTVSFTIEEIEGGEYHGFLLDGDHLYYASPPVENPTFILHHNTVSMEELRRQLGESLPGALAVMARAAKMEMPAFIKAVESGRVVTKDVLAKFAKEYVSMFSDESIKNALASPRAEINRLTNAITEAQLTVGKSGFLQGITESARELTKTLKTENFQASLSQLGHSLGTITGFLGKVAVTAIEFNQAILIVTSSIVAFKVASAIHVSHVRLMGESVNAAGKSYLSFGNMLKSFKGNLMELGLSAIAGGVVYLMTRQSEAEKIAVRYADTFNLVSRGAEAGTVAISTYTESIKKLTTAELERKRLTLGQDVASLGANLLSMSKGAVTFDLTELDFFSQKYASLEKHIQGVTQSYLDGKSTLSDYKQTLNELAVTQSRYISQEAIDKLIEMANKVDALRKMFESVKTELNQGLPRYYDLAQSFIDIAKNAGQAQTAIQSALNPELVKGFSQAMLKVKSSLASIGMSDPMKQVQEIMSKAGVSKVEDLQPELQTQARELLLLDQQRIKATTQLEIENQKILASTKSIKGVSKSQLDAYEKTFKYVENMYGSKMAQGLGLSGEEVTVSTEFEVDESGIADVQKVFKDYLSLAKLQEDAVGKTKSATDTTRAAIQMDNYYKDALNSVENLKLTQEKLISDLQGNTLASSMFKVDKDTEAQLDKLQKLIDKVSNKLLLLSKGKSGISSEAYIDAEKAKEQLEVAKNLVLENANYNKLLIEREELVKSSQLTGQYYELIGASQKVLEYEIKALEYQKQRTQNLQELQLIEENIARIKARKDIDVPALIGMGFQNENKKAYQDYLNIWEKDIPDAFNTFSDSFGKMFGNIRKGTMDIKDIWKGLGDTFSKVMDDLIADFISASMRMALFGGGAESGVLGGLLGSLGSMFGFKDGGVFSSGLSAHTNTILTKPTFFNAGSEVKPFANGGAFRAGVAGEAGSEAVMPLTKNTRGQLAVHLVNDGRSSSGVTVNVINQAGVDVQTKASRGSDGGERIDIMISRKVVSTVQGMFANGSMDGMMGGRYGVNRMPGAS